MEEARDRSRFLRTGREKKKKHDPSPVSTGRLRWRCRRGIKEMDALLERFLAWDYPRLSAAEQSLFEKLLDEADVDIYAWIMARAEPDNPDYLPVIKRLRNTAGK